MNQTKYAQPLQSISLLKKMVCLLFLLFPTMCFAQDQVVHDDRVIYRQFFSVAWGLLVFAITLYKAIEYVKKKRSDPYKPSVPKFLLFWAILYPLCNAVVGVIVYYAFITITGLPDIEEGAPPFPDGAHVFLPQVGMWIASIPLVMYLYKTGNNGEATSPTLPKRNIKAKGKFTESYYLGLKRSYNELYSIRQSIMDDYNLSEELNLFEDIGVKPLLTHYITFDLVQIVKLINGGYCNNTDLEVQCIALILSPLNGSFDFDSLESAKIGIERNIYKEVASNILNSGNKKSPLDISNFLKNGEAADETFALVPYLFLRNRQLHDQYAKALFEFAILTANADGAINTEEDARLNMIIQKTRNPILDIKIAHPPIPSNNKIQQISIDYHNLLMDAIRDFRALYEKLCGDKYLLTDLDQVAEIEASDMLGYIMRYDLSKIGKLLNENYSENDLEIISLALLGKTTLEEDNYIEHRQLNLGIERNIYNAIAKIVIETSNGDSILSINPSSKTNDELTPIEIDETFSLVPLLKLRDNPLFDEYTAMLYSIANIIAKADDVVTGEEEERLKVIYQKLHNSVPCKENKSLKISPTKDASLEEIQEELNSLIGLDHIKKELETLINFIKVQRAREEAGLKQTDISYHIVFTGNPGTGKTTVARIIAKVYKALGILTEGHLVETDRSGLIAEYSGQTAVKTNRTIDSALNGVLFIDEAYSLVFENKDDYGKEALATLLKRMEDDRDKLVVVVAGYTEEMKNFIDTNPGLRSRFNRYFDFEDYSAQELLAIYKLQCSKLEYTLTPEAESKVYSIMQSAYRERDKSFGNGRFSRNVFEKSLEHQANRIASVAKLDKEILTTITDADIPNSY